MKMRFFYNEYINKDTVYTEDLMNDLMNLLKIDEDDCDLIIEYIYGKKSLDLHCELNRILKNMTNEDKEIFKKILLKLETVFLSSRLTKDIIEDSYISLIENITKTTDGYIIFEAQMEMLYQTIGRTFLWTKYDKTAYNSYEKLTDYIYENMREYIEVYPKLINKILNSIDKINLDDNNYLFVEYGLKKKYYLNIQRQNARKNTALSV